MYGPHSRFSRFRLRKSVEEAEADQGSQFRQLRYKRIQGTARIHFPGASDLALYMTLECSPHHPCFPSLCTCTCPSPPPPSQPPILCPRRLPRRMITTLHHNHLKCCTALQQWYVATFDVNYAGLRLHGWMRDSLRRQGGVCYERVTRDMRGRCRDCWSTTNERSTFSPDIPGRRSTTWERSAAAVVGRRHGRTVCRTW